MTDNYSNTGLAERLNHLRRVVIKECNCLTYTAEGLKQADPEFRWLDAVDQFWAIIANLILLEVFHADH